MTYAQALQQEYANRTRLPAPSFQVGDLVTLNARNIKTQRPSKKLDWKRLGPFRIEEVVSSHAYRLALPSTMKVHDVFHVVLLEPAASDPFPGQENPPPPPVIVEGEEEWAVEEILDSRLFGPRKRLQYLVRWTGHPDPTWEPAEALEEVAAVDTFHNLFPNKPGPLSPEARGLEGGYCHGTGLTACSGCVMTHARESFWCDSLGRVIGNCAWL